MKSKDIFKLIIAAGILYLAWQSGVIADIAAALARPPETRITVPEPVAQPEPAVIVVTAAPEFYELVVTSSPPTPTAPLAAVEQPVVVPQPAAATATATPEYDDPAFRSGGDMGQGDKAYDDPDHDSGGSIGGNN